MMRLWATPVRSAALMPAKRGSVLTLSRTIAEMPAICGVAIDVPDAWS